MIGYSIGISKTFGRFRKMIFRSFNVTTLNVPLTTVMNASETWSSTGVITAKMFKTEV